MKYTLERWKIQISFTEHWFFTTELSGYISTISSIISIVYYMEMYKAMYVFKKN